MDCSGKNRLVFVCSSGTCCREACSPLTHFSGNWHESLRATAGRKSQRENLNFSPLRCKVCRKSLPSREATIRQWVSAVSRNWPRLKDANATAPMQGNKIHQQMSSGWNRHYKRKPPANILGRAANLIPPPTRNN
jgi:hypothetical protein